MEHARVVDGGGRWPEWSGDGSQRQRGVLHRGGVPGDEKSISEC